MKERKPNVPLILTLGKYLFSFILTITAFLNVDTKHYLVVGTLELIVIFVLSDILMAKKTLGRVMNSILLFMYNAQMFVLTFGSSYITLLMLENLHSLEDLAGKTLVYGIGIIVTLIFTFMPIEKMQWNQIKINIYAVLSCVLALELGFVMLFGNIHSPMFGYFRLCMQFAEKRQLEEEIRLANVATIDFYKETVEDYYVKDDKLPEKPNVILIFTEGLSQNIISDTREIMPNIAEWQKKSINFTNYYNHTFATYRGLIGQLYSGYQLNDFDANALVSIQEILEGEGYDTAFINTEPHNADFTKYLNNLGFGEVIGDESYECNGMVDSISDKDAYEILYKEAIEHHKTDKPFFISIYTLGTHASMDSMDQKFGDGSDAELNKFYDADYQFGVFMDKFKDSELAEDTLIVFTTDHATYADDSFRDSFPDYEREVTMIDKVPFFMYYEGIKAENIDVNGRNTLNMVPTLLDFLDISAENYFLGTSLFSDKVGNICETSYSDSHVTYTTEDAAVISIENENFNEWLKSYYITKGN